MPRCRGIHGLLGSYRYLIPFGQNSEETEREHLGLLKGGRKTWPSVSSWHPPRGSQNMSVQEEHREKGGSEWKDSGMCVSKQECVSGLRRAAADAASASCSQEASPPKFQPRSMVESAHSLCSHLHQVNTTESWRAPPVSRPMSRQYFPQSLAFNRTQG